MKKNKPEKKVSAKKMVATGTKMSPAPRADNLKNKAKMNKKKAK